MGKPIMKKIIIAILLCFLSAKSFAINNDTVFSVHDIGMDITAINSVQAKETAIKEAQKQAFTTLTKRLSMLTDNEILALNISNKEINSIISDFDISAEKSSDIRYTGVFNFNFNPKKTADFFNSKEIAFTSIRSGSVLIIPVWLEDSNEVLLWEEGNIWKQAWEQFPSTSFLVPTKLPFGDLTDLSEISAQEVMIGEMPNISNITSRYDVKDIVVTVAKKDKDNLLVIINRYGLNEVSSQSSILIEGEEKTYGQVLSEAVNKVNDELSTLWKEKTITRHDEINYIEAAINVSSVKDLRKIEQLLETITIINESKVNILTTEKAILDIYYQGSFFDFKLALSQLGITAEKTGSYSCKLSH